MARLQTKETFKAKEYIGIHIIFSGAFLFSFPLVVALILQAAESIIGAGGGLLLISLVNYSAILACGILIAYQFMRKELVLSLGSDMSWPVVLTGSCILLCLTILIAIQYSIASMLPIFGWDAVDFWADRAAALIKEHDMNDLTYDPRYIPANHRHPTTVSWLLALSADGSPFYIAPLGKVLFGGVLGVLLLVVGMALYFSKSWVASLLIGYLYLTQPLFENHILIAGYSEFWLTGCLLAGVIFALLWTQVRHLKFFYGFLFFMLLAALVRNTGVYFAILLTVGTLIPAVLLKSRGSRLAMMGAGAVAVLSIIYIWSADKATFDVAGWTVHVDFPISTDIFYGVTKAIFLNQSFSLLPFCLAVILSVYRNIQHKVFITYVSIFCLIAAAVFSAIFFLDYVSKFSLWGSDTVGSRLMLAPFCTVLVGLTLAAFSLEINGTLTRESRRKCSDGG